MYFFENGLIANDGVFEIDNKKYLFDSLGNLVKNKIYTTSSRKTYLANEDGIVIEKKGKQKIYLEDIDGIKNDFYFINENGNVVVDDFIENGNEVYYANYDGKLIRSIYFCDMNFDENGCLVGADKINLKDAKNKIHNLKLVGGAYNTCKFSYNFYKKIVEIDSKYDNYVICDDSMMNLFIGVSNNPVIQSYLQGYFISKGTISDTKYFDINNQIIQDKYIVGYEAGYIDYNGYLKVAYFNVDINGIREHNLTSNSNFVVKKYLKEY